MTTLQQLLPNPLNYCCPLSQMAENLKDGEVEGERQMNSNGAESGMDTNIESDNQGETRQQPRGHPTESKNQGTITKLLNGLNWVPPGCRYDPENPPKFTLATNILLASVRALC
jgi:hypothetical protein